MVQNMPGASTMTAANYVYNVAKPDGLTFAIFLPALYFDQLIGRKEVQFDWAKFTWLEASSARIICCTCARTPRRRGSMT